MEKKRNPWAWVPTLYFAEGLPNVVVMTLAVVMYMEMGMTDTEIALYTSWLGLPWVIKPLWSPFVDLFKTKRWWVLAMQLLLGAAFAGVAFTVNTDFWFQGTMFFFFLMAFSSATHDIAADGFYMLDLDSHDQAYAIHSIASLSSSDRGCWCGWQAGCRKSSPTARRLHGASSSLASLPYSSPSGFIIVSSCQGLPTVKMRV